MIDGGGKDRWRRKGQVEEERKRQMEEEWTDGRKRELEEERWLMMEGNARWRRKGQMEEEGKMGDKHLFLQNVRNQNKCKT